MHRQYTTRPYRNGWPHKMKAWPKCVCTTTVQCWHKYSQHGGVIVGGPRRMLSRSSARQAINNVRAWKKLTVPRAGCLNHLLVSAHNAALHVHKLVEKVKQKRQETSAWTTVLHSAGFFFANYDLKCWPDISTHRLLFFFGVHLWR